MAKKNRSWGGRFKQETAKNALEFSNSIEIDKTFYREDIEGSIAYAEALVKAKILKPSEFKKIKIGLNQIQKQIDSKKFNWSKALEDVHMNIEAALEKNIGDILDYQFTVNLEKMLDDISTGTKDWTGVVQYIYDIFLIPISIVSKKHRTNSVFLSTTKRISFYQMDIKWQQMPLSTQIS